MDASSAALPRVSVFLGLSLDGFIARADGGLDWLAMVERNPPEDTGYDALFASIDTLLLGRASYETVLGFDQWLYHGKTVVVLTHRPLEPRYGERAMGGDIVQVLRRLYQEGARHVYVDGGATSRQALAANVVDELTLSWLPIILGTGIPLFGPELPEIPLELKSSRSFPSGLVQAVYRRPTR